MTSKEARYRKRKTWRSRESISLLATTLAVLLVCGLVRYFWGTGNLGAQAPAANATSKTSGSNDTPAGPSQRKSTIVAVVNAEEISRQELAGECLRRYGADVLESMVNKQLIWQACQQQGISITTDDVHQEITRIAAKFGLSTDRWLQILEQERDVTPDQYRRDIVWPTLALRRLAADQIVVSDEEFNRAWEAEFGPKVKVRIIAVSSRGKADELRAKALAAPNDFGILAKDHSEDQTSAPLAGLIPPIRRHMGDANLERVAFALNPGDISEIVQVANQYIIMKCEQRLEPSFVAPQFLDDTKQRIRDRIRDEKLRSASTDMFRALQEQAKVVIVYGNTELERQHPGVAALINNAQTTIRQLAEECIVRHGKDVLEGEINRKVLLQEMKRRGTAVTETDIDREIARAADSYGYFKRDGSPDVEAWLKEVTEADGATVELYVRDAVWPTVALKKLVDSRVEVTDEDLRRGFVANYGERVEALAIVVTDHRTANKVFETARGHPTEEFFGELAVQYSVDPVSRANRGRIPPINRHGGQPILEEEAFSLKPGELSSVIAVEDKFIILRCLGRTKPVVQDFNAVKDELHKDLFEKKLRLEMAKEFDRLKESAQIDNFLAGTSQSGKRAPRSMQPSSADTSTRDSKSTARPVSIQRR